MTQRLSDAVQKIYDQVRNTEGQAAADALVADMISIAQEVRYESARKRGREEDRLSN